MNHALSAVTGLRAQIDWQPLFEDTGIPLAIMGLFVVYAALIIVRIFIGLLPRVMAFLDHLYPEHVEAAHHAPVQKPSANEIPDETLAVIAAAVAATICEPHRIVHTRELAPEDLNWAMEGRRQHHASHRIQHRDQH